MSRATLDNQQGSPADARAGEQGAVIVEFAAIFIVFATLLAGLITYGMVFAVQQTLEHGTSEAARSVVGIYNKESLEDRIEETLNDQLNWLTSEEPPLQDPEIQHWVCFAGDPAPCPSDVGDNSVHVRVRYTGGLLSLMPFQIVTPDQAVATATLDHDLADDDDGDGT